MPNPNPSFTVNGIFYSPSSPGWNTWGVPAPQDSHTIVVVDADGNTDDNAVMMVGDMSPLTCAVPFNLFQRFAF